MACLRRSKTRKGNPSPTGESAPLPFSSYVNPFGLPQERRNTPERGGQGSWPRGCLLLSWYSVVDFDLLLKLRIQFEHMILCMGHFTQGVVPYMRMHQHQERNSHCVGQHDHTDALPASHVEARQLAVDDHHTTGWIAFLDFFFVPLAFFSKRFS